mgnify:CR=1 FL=1|jgi:hypothetical protein
MKTKSFRRLKLWYFGGEENKGGNKGLVIYHRPHWSAKYARTLIKFIKQEWLWLLMFGIAVVTVMLLGR